MTSPSRQESNSYKSIYADNSDHDHESDITNLKVLSKIAQISRPLEVNNK